MFSPLDIYDSKLQSLSMFYLNQHSVAGTIQLPYFRSSCKVEPSCWFFIHIPSVFIMPHMLATITAIDKAKCFIQICEWARIKLNFAVMHLVLSEMIGGKAAVSAN